MSAMTTDVKGKSPFYPGQPVPVEFFIGRQTEIERVLRAIGQVELGKPQAVFLTGEYGIGKSSLAGFMRYYAEKNNHLLGIHALLGGAQTIDDIATKTVEAVLKTQAYTPTITESVRNFLSQYIGQQKLFGFSINLEKLKTDSPSISHGYLPFLQELLRRVQGDGIKGILLILDEINGITGNDRFSHFIKGLVDENALSPKPLPLLLLLCGVEERRREMIHHHQPIERIFDIVDIKPMSRKEMHEFYTTTFQSVGVTVTDEAMILLQRYSGGFPKIMHVIGDAVFWINKDTSIDKVDAMKGIVIAAEDIGKKFVDLQVYRALRSKDYHSILSKIGNGVIDVSFQRKKIEQQLSDGEKKKFDNFLRRMRELNVLRPGAEQGEYMFNSRLVTLYMFLLKPLQQHEDHIPQ